MHAQAVQQTDVWKTKRSKDYLSICLSVYKPHENQSSNSTATGLETEVKSIKAKVEEAKTLA
ncbi:MAG: hypothetical protein ACK55Z_09220, partial [bacterium]